MKDKKFALITSVGGHAFMELNFAKAYRQQPVVFSEKNNKEEFEKEVAEIYERFAPMFPEIKRATWDDAREVAEEGVSWRAELLNKRITADMWRDFAYTKLEPRFHFDLPMFKGIDRGKKNVLLIPQKLISDGKCGVTAQQQTVPLNVFNFFNNEEGNRYILGQHFHKVNDAENVKEIAKEFNMYVPGEKEDENVYGIRGVSHDQYLNMYKKLDMSIGVVGTHTWYMLTCFPEKSQILMYNRNGVENWDEIAKAYRKNGRKVYAFDFGEKTPWKIFALKVKARYVKLAKAIDKEKAKRAELLFKIDGIKNENGISKYQFKEAVEKEDKETIIAYIKGGGDINVELERPTLYWDGSIPIEGKETCRALDFVHKGGPLEKFLIKNGALPESHFEKLRAEQFKKWFEGGPNQFIDGQRKR